MEAIVARVGDEMGERIANKVLGLLLSNAGVSSQTLTGAYIIRILNMAGLTRCLSFGIPVAPSASSVRASHRVWDINTWLACSSTMVSIFLTFPIVFDLDGLLCILGSLDIPAQDLRRCLESGPLLSLEEQDRVKWIMRSPGLRKWVTYPQSTTILINGNMDANEVFSPTTFLAANVVETLQAIKPIITIQYFCSLRATAKNAAKYNASTILKSFIAQLLLNDVAWDLTFMGQEKIDKIESNDLKTLFDVFFRLLQQLPPMTFLYWIIDGITFYERSEWRDDLLKVIKKLLKIVKRCEKVVIKLLLTCHNQSYFVKDYIEAPDRFLVPSTVDGDLQGWSSMAWDRSMEKDTNALEGKAGRSDS